MARTSPGGDNRQDRDAIDDWGGTRGEDLEAPQFESGLDYAAYVEDDDTDGTDGIAGTADTEVISDVDRRAAAQADPDTQPTQSIDRRELDRLAAGDAAGEGAGIGSQEAERQRAQVLTGARAQGEKADVVTASAQPTPEPQPTSAWSGGPGFAPAPGAGDHRGLAGGSTAVEPEENRRELRDAEARAAARDEALKGSPTGPRVMQVLLAIFFPVVVLIAAVRLVASPVFLWIEYHRPGFPDDQYGFTTDDRLTYGSAGMDYLFNAAPPRYLGDLQHQGAALFTGTEVSHMADVKLVMLITMGVGLLLGLLCILFMVALSRAAKGGIRRALFAGSLWMLVVLIVLGVLAVLGWQQFFAAFHALFFADGTWTFLASDSLIRLYPNQFWIDAGLAVGVLVLLTLVVTLVFTWPTRRRRYDSRLAQEDLIRRRNDWADAA